MDVNFFHKALEDVKKGRIFSDAVKRLNYVPLLVLKNSIDDVEVSESGFRIGPWTYDGRKVLYKDTERVGDEEFIDWVMRFKDRIAHFDPGTLRRLTGENFRYVGIDADGNEVFTNGRCRLYGAAAKYRWDLVQRIEGLLGKNMECEVFNDDFSVMKRFSDVSVLVSGAIVRGKAKILRIGLSVEGDEVIVKDIIKGADLKNVIEILDAAGTAEEFFILFALF